MAAPARFNAPVPGISYFYDEATLRHQPDCDLRTQRPSGGRVGLACTCRAGPDSGDGPLEGPRVAEAETYDDQIPPELAARLRAENAELREKVRQLTAGAGGQDGLGTVDGGALPLGRMGVIRRGRR